MPKPAIAIPVVSDAEVRALTELRQSVRRVHKSVPPRSPVRRASADLSDRLQRLHRRGVPLHVLAGLVGLSHQAVRIRVRNADAAPGNHTAPQVEVTLDAPTRDVVLVTDAGVHRRLHVFDPPADAGASYLAMLPSIPLLRKRADILSWLESESAEEPSAPTSATATRLRVPPAVYLPRAIVGSVLVPLTTEPATGESGSEDAERESGTA